jgi:hypothetical protein
MRRLPLLLIAAVLAGCAGQKTTSTTAVVSSESSTKPVVAQASICPGGAEALNDLPSEQIRQVADLPASARAATMRVTGIPGPGRIECGVATGVVLGRRNDEVIVAVAGALAQNADTFWIDEQRATVLGRSSSPALSILRVRCRACSKMSPAKTTNDTHDPTLIGATNGYDGIVGHPASAPDGPYVFGGVGALETWVYTLVPQAAASGDGVWSRTGKWIGLAYAEERDAQRPLVHRVIYIPAGDVIMAAKASLSQK